MTGRDILSRTILLLLTIPPALQQACGAAVEATPDYGQPDNFAAEDLRAIESAWREGGEGLLADEYWEFETPLSEREWQPDYLYRRVCDDEARRLATEHIERLSSPACDRWRQLDADHILCEVNQHPGGGFDVFRQLDTGDYVLIANVFRDSFLEDPWACAQDVLLSRFWEALRDESCEYGPTSALRPTQDELQALLDRCEVQEE